MINDVQQFHARFGLPTGSEDVLTGNDEALGFRMKFMDEELEEFGLAMSMSDNVKAFDALLDLCYVAYGTALFLGISPAQWHAGMSAVHRANMAKVRATSVEQSTRGSTLDVIKPAGWVSPEAQLKEILSWRQHQPR